MPDEHRWTRHAAGVLGHPDGHAIPASLTTWPPPGATPVEVASLYDALADLGYEYGPLFQGLHAAWRAGEDIYADVSLPDGADTTGYGIHPALLDAALHPGALTADGDAGQDETPAQIRLPFTWAGVTLHATGATALRVRLSLTGPDTITLAVADAAGAPVATIDSLTLRPLPAGQLAPVTSPLQAMMFQLDWTPGTAPAQAAPPADGSWAVLGGGEELAAVFPAAAAYPDLASLQLAITDGAAAPGMVLAPCPAPPAAALPGAAYTTTHQALALVQDWLADDRLISSHLVIMTCGAVATGPGEHIAGLATAPVWGLLRSAQTENPGHLTVLDTDEHDTSYRAIPAALAAGEPQIALRDGVLYTPRLARISPDGLLAPPPDTAAWRLESTAVGTLENLTLAASPAATAPLQAGQVRVAVRAAGLNFRDVLIALGMYPDASHAIIGGEGAGVIEETGPDVAGLTPGDRVMGLFPGSMAPLAVTDHRLLTSIPAGWTFAQAAAAPIVFLTAYYALTDLGRLQPGEKLLIHAATGGVGQAAIQLARYLGAEAFTTASPAKQHVLTAQGIDDAHIASSRTLDFEQHFTATTSGTGLDVVLNALAGDFTDASLRLLSPGGRFLDMGKTDIRDPADTATRHPGTTYQAFDLVRDAGPDRVQQMLTELRTLFANGTLHPLPITAYDIRDARRAFRYLSEARQIGKVILTLPTSANPEGTTLITGATGTLGALLARHLITTHSARHLLLASRHGPSAPGASDLETELTALGATITLAACDVADPGALAALIAAIPLEHPLTTVIHTAGVLDDGIIGALTPDRIDTVLRPKVDAAWNLHQQTRDLDLSGFVLFSSIAGTLGAPGQANYAAANTFLDALATDRLSQGLPATALAWGLWAQASGMTGQLSKADWTRLNRNGVLPMPSQQGLALFDATRTTERAIVVPARLDMAALRAQASSGTMSPLLHDLIRTPVHHTATSPAHTSASLTQQLVTLSPADQYRTLLDLVRANAATVLGHATPQAIDPDRAFKELGFDSLTAVELRNRLSTATGLRLPTTIIFDYPTPDELTKQLLAQIRPDETAAGAQILTELAGLEAAIATLSPDADLHTKVADRLQSLLRSLNGQDANGATANDSDLESVTDDDIFDILDNELETP
jgi:polyketide synthase 12